MDFIVQCCDIAPKFSDQICLIPLAIWHFCLTYILFNLFHVLNKSDSNDNNNNNNNDDNNNNNGNNIIIKLIFFTFKFF